jgi:DNA-binding NarL/FixJ family response regulator
VSLSYPIPAHDQLRVLIADDHRLFAESLRALLSEDERIEVIGIAVDGNEAVELATSLVPDIVLMDLSMPLMDGLEATRRIHAAGLPTRVLILSGTQDQVDLAEVREAGADGFLRKEKSVDDLREIFFEVASLTSVLGGSIQRRGRVPGARGPGPLTALLLSIAGQQAL